MSDQWLHGVVDRVNDRDPEDRFLAMTRFLQLSLGAYAKMRRHMVRNMPGVPPLRYASTEELVLFNGVPKSTRITSCAFPEMRVGNCFGNAFELTLSDPTLRYVEGWACMEQGFPTHHGWVEDANGNIHDPTWLGIVNGHLANPATKLVPGYAARAVYLGVSIPRAHHIAWFEKHDTPNLLAFGEMSPREVLHDGMDAFADRVDPALEDVAIALVRETMAKVPQWQLNDDGSGYHRTNPDGTVQEWYP